MMFKKAFQFWLIVVVATIIVTACSNSSGPKSGTWVGTGDFGEAEFIVNSDSTAVTKFNLNLLDYECGPTTMSGGIGIERESGWPIEKGQFSLEINMGDPVERNQTMSIVGLFDDSGTQNSGTFTMDSYGTSCSGTWEASFFE